MDEVMRKHLSERMREALARGDMEELQRAQVDAMCAQMECQEHMAGRVKKIEGYIDRREAKAEGAGLMLKLIGALGCAGGGAAVMRVAQALL